MRFPRQENWSGLPFPSPEDLPNLGIEPMSTALEADSLPLNQEGSPQKSLRKVFGGQSIPQDHFKIGI